MSEMVKCSVCGKTFNDRYVNSHKRLAHDAKPKHSFGRLSEPEMIEEILSLYGRLSGEGKKELHTLLAMTPVEN